MKNKPLLCLGIDLLIQYFSACFGWYSMSNQRRKYNDPNDINKMAEFKHYKYFTQLKSM